MVDFGIDPFRLAQELCKLCVHAVHSSSQAFPAEDFLHGHSFKDAGLGLSGVDATWSRSGLSFSRDKTQGSLFIESDRIRVSGLELLGVVDLVFRCRLMMCS